MGKEYVEFNSALIGHINLVSDRYIEETEGAADLEIVWINYLKAHAANPGTVRLLDSVLSSIREVAGCLSVGFVRPAIFAIRTQLELAIAFLYYNDHPVEWEHAARFPKDFEIRGTNWKYLKTYGMGFDRRFKTLIDNKVRTNDDPYELLSAHVHGTSAYAAPAVEKLSDLIRNEEVCGECIAIQREVSEYISDVYSCWYVSGWKDFPSEIRANIQGRLKPKTLAEFCGS